MKYKTVQRSVTWSAETINFIDDRNSQTSENGLRKQCTGLSQSHKDSFQWKDITPPLNHHHYQENKRGGCLISRLSRHLSCILYIMHCIFNWFDNVQLYLVQDYFQVFCTSVMWIQDQEPNAQGTQKQKQKQKQTKNKIQFSSAVYGGGRGHSEKSWLLSTLQTVAYAPLSIPNKSTVCTLIDNRWSHKMFKTASGTASVVSTDKREAWETWLYRKRITVCDFFFFTANLKRANEWASEREFVMCCVTAHVLCVCTLIDNGREPIRNKCSGFLS